MLKYKYAYPFLFFSETENFDLAKSLEDWTEDDSKDETAGGTRVGPYCHYRTRFGSPSVTRRSFTEEEITRFICEFCSDCSKIQLV